MSALLKQKAKVGVATKERKSYDIADVFKRVKRPDGTVINVPQEGRSQEEVKDDRTIKKIIKPLILEKYHSEVKK